MDTNNPGEELLVKVNQMQQNADLQQVKQEEVQGFRRQTFFAEHPALSDAQLDQFRQDQTEMVHEFLAVYKERAIKSMPDKVSEKPVIAENTQAPPPVQEEPDEKALKKKQKQREKKIKEGKKKGILAASEYSADMQKNYSAYMKRKQTNGYKEGKNPELWKRCISRFEANPVIGDPAYVGENLQEAQEYMDDLKEAIDYFTQHPEILNTMSLTFQQKVGSAMQSYSLMESAYENALMKNGLKRSGNRLVPIDANDLLQLRSDDEVRQKILEQAEKNQAELDAVVAEEVEIHSKQLLAKTQEKNQPTRAEYKAKDSTSFIETERMSNPFHFEALDIYASMLEQHPEEYAANKEVLDSIMAYLRNIMEAVALYTSDGYFDENMPEGIEPEVEAAIYERQDKADFKKDDLQETITMLEMGLKHILEGKPIHDRMAEFLYQFGYASPEYLAEQKKVVEDAQMYIDTFEFKTALWMSLLVNESEEVQNVLKGDSRAFMLMQMEDTEEAHRYNLEVLEAKKQGIIVAKCNTEEQEYKSQHPELKEKENAAQLEADEVLKALQKKRDTAQSEMVRLYKSKFQALYDKVMNMELESLQAMEPREIMRRQEEFLRVGMENMHMSDCCKTIDPVTKKSVRALVFPTPELEAIYASKISLIQNYMVMGRMLSMMEAYKKDSLTRDALTDTEQKKTGIVDIAGEASDEVLEFAKKSYHAAKITAGNYQKLLGDSYREYFRIYSMSDRKMPTEKFTPLKMEDKISEAVANNKEYIGDKTEESNRAVYYDLVQAGKQEEADLIEANICLVRNGYHLAGETEGISEALFRSFAWAEKTKGLKDMPESEFNDIVKLLSAGHLKMSREQMAEKKITEPMDNVETKEELQAKNKEGLRRLLHAEAPHLDYLEKKYGYEVPTYEYVVAHIDELHDDFLFGQVTEDIITHFNILDSNNPEDVRLMHQVHFYNEVGMKVVSLFTQSGLAEDAGGTKLELINYCRDTNIIADSLNYLKEHPMTAGSGE